jgi:hypothetical protein
MDLALAGRVDTDRDRVLLVDQTPIGTPLLDPVLTNLGLPETPADAPGLILLLARQGGAMRAALLDRLVAAGALAREQGRFLFLLADPRFPKPAGASMAADDRVRLRALLLAEEIPAPEAALLLGLARAAGLLPLILPAEELGRVHPWLALVTRIESLNRLLGTAVADLRAARRLQIVQIS